MVDLNYKCNTCGDYEYCAGYWDTDKCTGYIPAATIHTEIGAITDL